MHRTGPERRSARVTPNSDPEIFLSDLTYDAAEREAVAEVLSAGWLTMGPRAQAFEQRVAEVAGTEHAVCLSSCTAGLYLILHALDIGPGDEVLVPSLTFAATANVILNRGATPVFCDIVSPEVPLIDPADVRRKLTDSTRAVFAVDYAGFPCDYDAIAAAIDDFASGKANPGKIHILEDAAHGIGGALDASRAIGNCGEAAAYSFFSNKNLATGEGGMVVTNNAAIADRVRLLRAHGMTKTTWERHRSGPQDYDVVEAGWNYRPSEILAALGLVQLDKLAAGQERRKALVAQYCERLAEIQGVTVPFEPLDSWYRPAFHIFPILLADEPARNAVQQHLYEQKIQTSHHYTPIHLFTYYQQNVESARLSLPMTEDYARRELTLPLHPGLSEADIDRIVDAVREGIPD